MEAWLTEMELPKLFKLKVIFVNLFCALYKAATLNLLNLLRDLQQVKNAFPISSSLPTYVLQNLIPLFLLLKFITGYFSLAAKVIAILPILSDQHPEMLLPTIILQLFENLLLPLVELVLGYIAAKFTVGDCTTMLPFFTLSLVLKIVFGVVILNLYMNLYGKIHAPSSHSESFTIFPQIESEETFLNKESLT